MAELLRSKPWAPATLDELGGAGTIGATILDEAFSSPQAPPQNRVHRPAAQAVLRRLLPEGGVLIKGHVSSRQALLDASGYSTQPREFQELMWILDHELRLVTPADPLCSAEDGEPPAPQEGPRYYQLTHDYLIPDLRAWLVRDQQKSLRGRAHLRLQEFASVWTERHKDKFLPSALEWAALRLLTDRKRWSAEVRAMMRAAAARHARGALVVGRPGRDRGPRGCVGVRGAQGPIAGRGPQERRHRPGLANHAGYRAVPTVGPGPSSGGRRPRGSATHGRGSVAALRWSATIPARSTTWSAR